MDHTSIYDLVESVVEDICDATATMYAERISKNEALKELFGNKDNVEKLVVTISDAIIEVIPSAVADKFATYQEY